jgi:hypothetical protein
MMVKTSIQERQQFFVLHQQEETYTEIAERYGVSSMCVRYWCRRQRDGKDCQTRRARGKPGLLSRFDGLVRYVLLRLRLEHPHWGPNRIREKMKKRPSLLGRRLPSEAEIGRYLHQWRRFWRKANKKPPCLPADQPCRVFQRWQMDFKVQIRLKNGMNGTLFSVRDEVGEAIIGNVFMLSGKRSRVKMEEARAVLRHCFEAWGTLPEEVQTDGESTLVSSHKNAFPSRFTLWMTGLGIQHRVIKNVTSNAEVERCHRTLCDYAIVGNEDHLPQELQWILDQAAYELNYELPSQAQGCQGKPPVSAHPELLLHPRPYQAAQELSLFDLHRVDEFLATFTWIHRANAQGQVWIGLQRTRYTASKTFAGQDLQVRFDPQDRHFVFSPVGRPKEIIRRCPVKGLDVADLTGLDVWPLGAGPQQLVLPNFFDKRGKLLMSK